MRKTDPKRIIFLWISSVSFWNRGQARNLARLHRRFAKEGPLAADRLATSDAGKPQSQRLAPLNHPQGRIPTRMPGAWWIQGEIPLLEPPKGIEKKIFKIK